MASFWDLFPASPWSAQPFTRPLDPMQPERWPQTTAPAWDAATPTPAGFGWLQTPAAPTNALPYDRADDSSADLGSLPNADVIDPARTAQLLEDARRAHAFALWAFGGPAIRPAQQTRDVANPYDVPALDVRASRNAVAAGADARTPLAGNSGTAIAQTAPAMQVSPPRVPMSGGDVVT